LVDIKKYNGTSSICWYKTSYHNVNWSLSCIT